MISALIVATVIGVLTTYSLIGRSTTGRGVAPAYLLGFGVLSIAGAGFDAITLPWAVGIAVSVGLGLLLAPLLPARSGPFAAAVSMTAGLVMAAGIVRWLVPIAADLSNLDARMLALVVIAAAAVWAVGRTGTWARTAAWLSIVVAVLLFVAGIVAGAPGTLTAPLVSPEINPAASAGWLVLVVLFTLQHPSPPRSLPGIGLVVLSLLLGLVGLMSLLGGWLTFPSTGLITVAGYASIATGLPGAVLGVIALVVAVVATGLTMRVVLEPWGRFTNPLPLLSSPGRRIVAVAVLVGMASFAPVPTALIVAVPAVFGVVALIADRRAAPPPAVQVQPADSTSH